MSEGWTTLLKSSRKKHLITASFESFQHIWILCRRTPAAGRMDTMTSFYVWRNVMSIQNADSEIVVKRSVGKPAAVCVVVRDGCGRCTVRLTAALINLTSHLTECSTHGTNVCELIAYIYFALWSFRSWTWAPFSNYNIYPKPNFN